jgi:ATP-binding cassette subfamily F protein 3
MAKAEENLSAIRAQLADPELYNGDNKERVATLLREEGELKLLSENLEEQWLTLQQELEDLDD